MAVLVDPPSRDSADGRPSAETSAAPAASPPAADLPPGLADQKLGDQKLGDQQLADQKLAEPPLTGRHCGRLRNPSIPWFSKNSIMKRAGKLHI